MTRDDIIRMAREAGFVQHSHPNLCDLMISSFDDLERFAELVAAAQLEACIQACDSVDLVGADECIEAIRARGQV